MAFSWAKIRVRVEAVFTSMMQKDWEEEPTAIHVQDLDRAMEEIPIRSS